MSLILLNVNMDHLSTLLNHSSIGCNLNHVYINHVFCADESVILAPSPLALQLLLNYCDTFAKDNELVYNTKTLIKYTRNNFGW